MNSQPEEMQRWMLGTDSKSLIKALELMEDLHLQAMKAAEKGSLTRAEHQMLRRSYERAIWAIKYDKNIGRIMS